MAWNNFIVQTKTSAGAGTGVKVTLRKMKQRPPSLGLTLTSAIAAQLGWVDEDRLEVLIGDGAQHGLVRMRKNNSVGTALVEGKKAIHESQYFKITLGHVPAFVDRAESAKWAQFEEIDEGWVEFVMPSWADETAPRNAPPKPPAAPSAAIVAAASFQRPTRSATASLMGDPPPSRSALADRKQA